MDNFGDLFSGLGDFIGEVLGDGAQEGSSGGLAAFLGGGKERDEAVVVVTYERYLCGGPRRLSINDR